MIKGNNVYLSALEKQDLPLLMQWRNKPEFRMHFREYRELNSDMQMNWYNSRVMSDPGTIMFAIHRLKDNQIIGCCGICYINWINRCGDISLYIGQTYLDEFAEEALKMLLNYAFNDIGLHKLWAEIYELDKMRKDLFSKLQFNLDGVQRDHYFWNGTWHDSSLYSILEHEFRDNKNLLFNV